METATEQLKHLILDDVAETGKKLGSGAFGEVVEVRLSGLKCAGKKLHGVFFDRCPLHEQRAIASRFAEECAILSKLRHPNIVQLMGVSVIRGTRLPMMIMELLPESLAKCLERHRQIPRCMKTSILYDVSLGLLYLHRQTPPIIHRDLTANNVLLTSNMSAKLADLGVARIVNLNPAQMMACMTQCPGTPAYMPPEAMSDRPQYDEKLDVFSFGNLILHVCTQQCPVPAPLLAYDPQNPGVPKPMTEVQRRQRYFDLINRSSPLRSLAEKCLQNFPSQRPSTANITYELEQIQRSNASLVPNLLEVVLENMRLKERERQLTDEIAQLRQGKLIFTPEADQRDVVVGQLSKENASAPWPVVDPKLFVNSYKEERIVQSQSSVNKSLQHCLSASLNSHVLDEPSQNPLPVVADVSRREASRTESLSSSSPASPETDSSLDDIGDDADRDVDMLSVLQKELFDAVKRGNLAKVKELHSSHGEQLTSIDPNGLTPLHHAARLGRKEIVKYIVANIPKEALDARDEEKAQTALHKAAWYGYRGICKILVDAGSSLTCTDYQGNTPYIKSIQSDDTKLQLYLKRKESQLRTATSLDENCA